MRTLFAAPWQPIDIPAWVVDFDSFRRWMHTPEFPEKGRVFVINGTIWVDPKVDEFYEHGQVVVEIGAVLHRLVKTTRFGRFAIQGTRYSHLETGLTTEPDGMVISAEALADGRVEFVGGQTGNNTEVTGTPDLVIEVVSRSSVEKDTEWLLAAYHAAGIPEYWLIDTRDEDDVRFDILTRTDREYVAGKGRGGWRKSPTLGKSFRLVRTEDEAGNPEFTLEVR